ncbi:MAG: glycosyltransferase family 2 protein [Kaiparowitsia implicata GSE-PSE-MK54-09C]|jgi:hypothetical protein|nr:glycosyltransferase family 2 protein [Kaiparowitsia implicata GSE-PSE-MK54-09C]
MGELDRILVLIPVRDEADTITAVIQTLQHQGLSRIRVIDNGSGDGSGAIARAAGAEVIAEPLPGYGRACWRGLHDLPPDIEWILFCDGDGSDDLAHLPELLAARADYDLILGDRRAILAGRAALTPAQQFGNGLAGVLIGWGWGHRYHDLGPCRLIRRQALDSLHLRDRGFGWTVEMQVRAVEAGLRICELPVHYRPRQGGKSKISGTILGSVQAGVVILSTLAGLYGQRLMRGAIATASPLLGLSALLLLLGCAWAAPHGTFSEPGMVPRFWVGTSLMSVGFGLSWGVRSLSSLWFWGVALLARVLLLPMQPGSDIWRYIWEGYIQTLGFSPYHLAPNAAELEPYRTAWWGLINHSGVSAIYPPLAQSGFRLLAAIAPSVLLFKLAFVLADLIICGLLRQRYGPRATLLYAWNPLVIYAFAGGGHYDSWFLLPLVGAWLWFDAPPAASGGQTERSLGTALLLGLSIAVKWVSLPLLGFVAWRSLRGKGRWQCPQGLQQGRRAIAVLALGSLPLVLLALPFCTGNECPLIPTSSTFVSHGRSAELVPYLLAQVSDISRAANWPYGLPLLLGSLVLMGRSHRLLSFGQGFFVLLLLLSPIVHAWYFTWLIPFSVATRHWGIRWVSLSAFIYYALPHRMAMGNPDWVLTPTERWVLWAPLVLGSLWMLVVHPKLKPDSANSQVAKVE